MAHPPSQATRRLANLLGAAAIGISDAMSDALGDASGLDPIDATALIALLDFAPSRSVRFLSQVLGLTHSGAVRLVDRLSDAGMVMRDAAPGDERAVAVRLTPRGRRTALRLRLEREAAIVPLLAVLPPAAQAQLTSSLETLLGALARTRLEARLSGAPPSNGALCRLCDFAACQRQQGRCPVSSPERVRS